MRNTLQNSEFARSQLYPPGSTPHYLAANSKMRFKMAAASGMVVGFGFVFFYVHVSNRAKKDSNRRTSSFAYSSYSCNKRETVSQRSG